MLRKKNRTNGNKLLKVIDEMEKGKKFYVNFINLPYHYADEIRALIEKKVIIPDSEELKKYIRMEVFEEFYDGTFLLPQETFIKL